jgi:hypothetical protein
MKQMNRAFRACPDSEISPSTGAKWVTAVLPSARLDAVLKSVKQSDVHRGITVAEVRAHHCFGGGKERRAGVDFDVSAVSWVKIKLLVPKPFVNKVVEVLRCTGRATPDRIWISAPCTLQDILQEDQGLFHVQN